jgi:hypothetical protein
MEPTQGRFDIVRGSSDATTDLNGIGRISEACNHARQGAAHGHI